MTIIDDNTLFSKDFGNQNITNIDYSGGYQIQGFGLDRRIRMRQFN